MVNRVLAVVPILLLLLVGIPFVVGGVWLFIGLQGNDDPGVALFLGFLGSLAILIGTPLCLGAGCLAAWLEPWRSQQPSRQGVGKHNRAIMKKTLTGALIGFFAGGLLILVVVTARFYYDDNPLNHAVILALVFSPFGAVPGIAIGAVVGAVISLLPPHFFGSRWGAKPADAVMTRPQQGFISPSDLPKPQPGEAKCPFCRSIAFRVIQEAGCRRCGDCHSVLPNYIQGNR